MPRTPSRTSGKPTRNGHDADQDRAVVRTLADSSIRARDRDRPRWAGEKGATGTAFFSGFLSGNEFNPELQGERGIRTLERMFKTDGTARAIERACTLPVRSAVMSVEAPSDLPDARERAEQGEKMLRAMRPSWAGALRQCLLYLRYGHYPFEIVWGVRDGQYVVEKLAPRPPKTIAGWYTTPAGEFAGIKTRVWVPGDAGFGKLTSGQFKEIDIEAERLLLLVNDQEGNDFTGESLGRSMHKHWYIKENLEKITAIGVERREIGTEYAQMGRDASDDDADDIFAVLMSLHANERGTMIVPPKDIVDSFGVFGTGEGRGSSIPLIEYHQKEMARSYLADFLTITSGGSYALSRDKTSFFLMAVKSIADYIADELTQAIIVPWERYNYGPRDEYCRVRFSRLETRDLAAYASTIVQLVGAGALTIDRVVKAALRNELDFPPEEEDALDEGMDDEVDDEAVPDTGEPPNLLLSRDDAGADVRELEGFDPSRYQVTPDPSSKLGYKVVDRRTGKRLTGFSAMKVIESAQKAAGASARTSAAQAERERKKAAKDAERAQKKAEKDTERERKRAERETTRAQKQAERDAAREEKAALSTAKKETADLEKATARLDADTALKVIERAGYEAVDPDEPENDYDAAVEKARRAAADNPDRIFTLVKTKRGYIAVSKPKKALTGAGGPSNAALSQADAAPDPDAGDEADLSYDSGVPDEAVLRSLTVAAERLAPLFAGPSEAEDDESDGDDEEGDDDDDDADAGS